MKKCILVCLLVVIVVSISFFVPTNHVASQTSAESSAGNVLGWIDDNPFKVDAQGTYITGWSCQQRVSAPIKLKIYAGQSAGRGGELVMTTSPTNVQQPENAALNTLCGTENIPHRYKFYISKDNLNKFQGKTLYVHGIPNVELSTTPATVLNNSGIYTFPKPSEPLISSAFSAGDKIRASTPLLNIRSVPNGTIVGKQTPNSSAVIATPAQLQNGIKVGSQYWWYVDFATGVDGWTAEPFIIKDTTVNNKAPIIGMHYDVVRRTDPSDDCGLNAVGLGWLGALSMMGTKSLLFDGQFGNCYSSFEPESAFTHAPYLIDMGVDFVLADATNVTYNNYAATNPEMRAFKAIQEGFKEYAEEEDVKRLKAVPMFAFFMQYYSVLGTPRPEAEERALFCRDNLRDGPINLAVKDNVREYLELYEEDPEGYVTIDGKPLVVFFIAHPYMSGRSLTTGQLGALRRCDNAELPIFLGPHGMVPSENQIVSLGEKLQFEFGGRTQSLFDIAEVRYMQVPNPTGPRDLGAISSDIWPWYGEGFNYSESAWLSLSNKRAVPTKLRDVGVFEQMLNANRNKDIYLIYGWNGFSSSGDEVRRMATTIEPNTVTSLFDGSPKNNPWYVFNFVKTLMRKLKEERGSTEQYPPSPSQKQFDLTKNRRVITNLSTATNDRTKSSGLWEKEEHGFACAYLNNDPNKGVCYDTSTGISLRFSSSGPLSAPYQHCTLYRAPNNYLCANKNLGLTVSANPVSSKYCIELGINKDALDGFLCSPTQTVQPISVAITEPVGNSFVANIYTAYMNFTRWLFGR